MDVYRVPDTEYRIPQDPDDPEAAPIELLTDSVVIEYHAPPGYAEAVASGRAFAGMMWADARRAANTISRDIWRYGVEDPRVASSLRQRAANIACGSDVQSWHDRSAVSNAFGITADALAESSA